MLELGEPIEYYTKENHDGTFRDMTPEERSAFKPTHVTTYGRRNGIDGSFTTDLATNETVFQPLITTLKDYLEIWGI